MPISRSSDQKGQTLEANYQGLLKEKNQFWADLGKGILAFLSVVNEIFKTTQLWAFTSHERLVIQAEDNLEAPSYVVVGVLGKQYTFDYKMPSHKAPWPHATVQGTANSLEEAKKYLLIAMRECEGWKNSEELQQLLSEIEQPPFGEV